MFFAAAPLSYVPGEREGENPTARVFVAQTTKTQIENG